MKAFEIKVAQTVLLMVILAVIAAVVFYNLVNPERVQAVGYTPPVEKIECEVNSDCSTNNYGQLCLSINNQKSFCGCLEDIDCLGTECFYNTCR